MPIEYNQWSKLYEQNVDHFKDILSLFNIRDNEAIIKYVKQAQQMEAMFRMEYSDDDD